MNLNGYGYSLLHDGEMTYEELMQIEEQIGSIPKGLSEATISQLPKMTYKVENTQEMYFCIDSVAAFASMKSQMGRRSLPCGASTSITPNACEIGF